MTREEAIDALYRTDKLGVYSETHEAVNMAIEALKAQPEDYTELKQESILAKVRAEIEQGYCKIESDYDKGRNMGLRIAMQIIDKYKSECEDKG